MPNRRQAIAWTKAGTSHWRIYAALGGNKLISWTEYASSSALQGVVSLTFRELSKIISRKYTIPKMTFMVRISSWNFVRVPKAWLWAHVQSFSLKFAYQVLFPQYTNFERILWRAREMLVKQPPGPLTLVISPHKGSIIWIMWLKTRNV